MGAKTFIPRTAQTVTNETFMMKTYSTTHILTTLNDPTAKDNKAYSAYKRANV